LVFPPWQQQPEKEFAADKLEKASPLDLPRRMEIRQQRETCECILKKKHDSSNGFHRRPVIGAAPADPA